MIKTMSTFASVEESNLFGVDDAAFASFPADSLLPPPFFDPTASDKPFQAWTQQCSNNRARFEDSTKRLLHNLFKQVPPVKSTELLDSFAIGIPDESLVAIRDPALLRKRLSFTHALSQFSLRRQFEIERLANRYFRLSHTQFFALSSAYTMSELMFLEKQLHPRKTDWFAWSEQELRSHRPQDLAFICMDLTGGGSGISEFVAFRKHGKAHRTIIWDAALIDPSWRQPAFPPKVQQLFKTVPQAHIFDLEGIKALVEVAKTTSVKQCVPLVFADGCTLLHTDSIINTLDRLPTDVEIDYYRSVSSLYQISATSGTSISGLDALPANCQFEFSNRSVDVDESARVIAALDELTLRVSERCVLGQLLVMLQVLELNGSAVIKIENLSSPFLMSVVLTCAATFNRTSINKLHCSPSDSSCLLICKMLNASPDSVIRALTTISTACSRDGFGVDLLQQVFAAIREARAYLCPLQVVTENGDMLLMAPRSPLETLLELTRTLPPLPSLFEIGVIRRSDGGVFGTLVEELHDRLISEQTQMQYQMCRFADLPLTDGDVIRAHSDGFQNQIRKLKEFELPIDPKLKDAAAAALTAVESAAPAKTLKRKEPTVQKFSLPSQLLSQSPATRPRPAQPVVSERPVEPPRISDVNLHQSENPFFPALLAESARRERLRLIAAPPLTTSLNIPYPDISSVNLHQSENPFFPALMAESARRQRVRAH